MMRSIYTFIFLTLGFYVLNAQLLLDADTDPALLNSPWDASWVSVPGSDPYNYGVYFYRNTLELDQKADKFIIHISADNRYKLFVNKELVGLGPARSDTDNWNYESYDLAGYLSPGKNVIAVKVWNYGEAKPWAQLSLFSAFIVQGNSEVESVLNTPGTWKCNQVDAYKAITDFGSESGTSLIVGPGDHIVGKKYPWNWMSASFDDVDWKKPARGNRGVPKGIGTNITHALVPRTIPAMELSPLPSPKIRKIDSKIEDQQLNDYIIQAKSKTIILLDQEKLVTAYPELTVSGGKDASIKIGYSETLYKQSGMKGNRDQIQDMLFRGNYDIFEADGGEKRKFSSLWFRTFRYIQLEIETQDEGLTIHSMDPVFTAYPYKEKAWFKSDNDLLTKIWNTGWHTSRLCANELYYDCPYYEQLQYVGDTRVQALIALYVSGDDRLMRKAIDDFYHSIIPEGLTLSRYPTFPKQVIPTYSLFWVSMIHDYLWHNPDFMFPSKYLVSIQHILQWFENRVDAETGMLGPVEYWPFVDWTSAWTWNNEKGLGGVPKGGQEGNSTIITLQYAMTLDQAADIFNFYGLESLAKAYISKADQLVKATKKACWDGNKMFFADTPGKKHFSQHANILAVLTNAVPEDEKALLIERTARSEELIQTSYYFRFYLHRALIEAGLGNKFLDMLGPWEEMLDMGLTTFAEMHDLERTRSDCHAWSSSPLYEMLSTVAGIRPAEFGFRSVIIKPHPGSLKMINAGIPHYLGGIEVDLKFDKKGKVKGSILLPEGLKGIFVWDKQTIDLKGGENKISLGPLDSKFR